VGNVNVILIRIYRRKLWNSRQCNTHF